MDTAPHVAHRDDAPCEVVRCDCIRTVFAEKEDGGNPDLSSPKLFPSHVAERNSCRNHPRSDCEIDVLVCEIEESLQYPRLLFGSEKMLPARAMWCSKTTVIPLVIWQVGENSARRTVNHNALVPFQPATVRRGQPKSSFVCICQIRLTLVAVKQYLH